jgi:O-antigen/teichoic acid export membrane protein
MVATVNMATGFLQFEAWRRYASHIQLTLRGLDFNIVKKMLSYCSTLAIWSVGMLCVSGLDVTIVGRYDYAQTAFYSVATLPTNFAISIMGAALAPLLPSASALSVHRNSFQMGDILSRVTRYSSILLVGSGLPLLVAGYWILRLWVGPNYAIHTLPYLRILIIANVLRNVCMPYASMLVATDSQRVAIAGATAEAVVNVASSVYLAQRVGAIGVAYGTLIGSFVSVGMHFALNMHYTQSKFAVSRTKLFLHGLARPMLIAVPSLLLVRLWWATTGPSFSPAAWILWGLSSLLIAWYAGLNRAERDSLVGTVGARFTLRSQ